MEPRKQAILDALTRFMNQRSGIEFGNYGDVKAFRAEQRSIYTDLKQARVLLAAVKYADGIDADALLKAAQGAYSGRLMLTELFPPNGVAFQHSPTRDVSTFRVDYCTGQYFPTEYRRAVCAVLASALWEYTREKCIPPVAGYRVESWSQLGKCRMLHTVRDTREEAEAECETLGGSSYGHVNDVYLSDRYQSAGDWLRAHFRREFGRTIAGRWFS